MELRLARIEDADAVADVFIPSFGGLTFLPVLHSDEEHRAFAGRLVRDTEVWVAEESARIVGFASLSEARLEHLYVHPDAQGRGVGSALLAKAKERRPVGFELWVFQQNEGARRFYARHGLRLVRLTDGSGSEERVPVALYEWRP